jgi:hypothetical protein
LKTAPRPSSARAASRNTCAVWSTTSAGTTSCWPTAAGPLRKTASTTRCTAFSERRARTLWSFQASCPIPPTPSSP